MTAFAYLCRYVNRHFSIRTPGIQPSHRLQQDLGLNEIEALEVIVHLELVYGATLPDSTLIPSLSVAKLCALIEQFADKEQPVSVFQVYRSARQGLSRAD